MTRSYLKEDDPADLIVQPTPGMVVGVCGVDLRSLDVPSDRNLSVTLSNPDTVPHFLVNLSDQVHEAEPLQVLFGVVACSRP